MLKHPQHFFATCAKGLEEVLATELRKEPIGAKAVALGSSGVYFSGNQEIGYRACLWSRCAVRVLQRAAKARIDDAEALYEWARSLPWPDWMGLTQTFSVEARVWDSEITHSKYAALRVKDALCDIFRERTGRRPDVDTKNADLPLFLYLYRNEAVLYRDWSGQTLHKRGYRSALHKSSLNECIAAGILMLAGWDSQVPLADPMCGSGTFAIEAALLARQHAPGLLRDGFPFEKWPDFESLVWKACKDEARERERAHGERSVFIGANDRHGGALKLARRDAQAAGVLDAIRFSHGDVETYRPERTPALVVTNPPWGLRLDPDDVAGSWARLGRFLKTQCDGATAWILSGCSEATRHLRLKAARKFPLRYGKLDCRILSYPIRGRRPAPTQ